MISVAVLCVVAVVCAQRFTTRLPTARTSASEIVTRSTDAPDEAKPGSGYQWRGKPNDPKKLKIASINVDAFLQNVGVDQNKSVAVPNNVHMGGWFVDSVRPGEKGLSIIDGHYDGRVQTEAIFKDLDKVRPDDRIVVEFGNGSTKTFRVSKVTTTTIAEAASVLFSQDPQATNQLNLITCGGTYLRDAKTYDKRVIVSAQLTP